MTVGIHREKPINSLATSYLAWFISQDNIRQKYPKTTLAILAELRIRFLLIGAVESEMVSGTPVSQPHDTSDLI